MRVKYFYNWGYFYPAGCGADLVAINHIQYFQQRGWEVDCLLSVDPRKESGAAAFCDYYSWFRSITVGRLPTYQWRLGDCLHAFDHMAKHKQFEAALREPADLFLTNYVFSAPLLQYIPKNCRRILETIDIMSDQFSLAEPTEQNGKPTFKKYRTNYQFQIELELYRLFDSVIMINKDETERARLAGANNVYYVPRWCEMPILSEHQSDRRYDLLFVASSNPINQAGINWFYRNVYVRYLWRRGVRLAIAGGICKMLDFQDQNVELLGIIDGPLDPVYAASSIVIAPIFVGTGLSIKTVEALSMGKVVVGAPAAARGLDTDSGAFVTLDMKADPEAVANVILRLLSNPDERRNYEIAARNYAMREFSQEKFLAAMDRVFQAAGFSAQSPNRLSA